VARTSLDATVPSVQSGSSASLQSSAIFARKGDYWTIGLADLTFAVRDVKGLSYVQRLLQHPGEEFHALDLLGVSDTGGASAEERIEKQHESSLPAGVFFRWGLSGDAGEILDAQAKKEYRRRLAELAEELEERQQRGDADSADELQSEIDFIKSTLSRAVGLGGRDRRTGSAAERARLNVTRAVRAALQKVSEQHAAVGALLNRCIRTGSFCSYLPDPRSPINWQFSVEGAETAIKTLQAEPKFSPADISFVRALTTGSVFVGRDSERAMLMRSLEEARGGQGKLVLIDGAAGVGKTRIAAEIAVGASQEGVRTFAGGCYDRDDPVPFIPFVEILETALAQTPNLARLREALGDDAAEMARLVPQLRRSFPDVPPPAELPPEQSRRLLFSAFSGLVKRISGNSPILFLIDDLHWADEGTLLLLSYLAQIITELPVMIVGTFRTFEPDPGGHLSRTLDELNRRHLVERLSLRGLSESAVAEMLRALSGQEPPQAIVRLFHSDTEGNPFFVEELFKHLVEQGKLLDSSGNFRHNLEIDDIDVPQSLRLVIGRRLARFGDATVKALGTAAVIGRSFTFDLLTSATDVDADSLLDCIEESERAGLITATIEYPEARFRFSHELIRQAVVSGLSAPRRQRLHLDVAKAIEHLSGETVEDHAEDLAHHLWNAGSFADRARTLRYLRMAGEKAAQRSANLVAINHFKNALKLVSSIPESPERLEQELMLNTALGTALVATKGFSSLEVGTVFGRARELCQQVNETPQLFRAFWGLWINYASRSEHEVGFEMGEQCLRLAQASGDSGLLVEAHHALGTSCCVAGEFARGLELLEQAIAIYNPVDHEALKFVYGQDAGVACLIHAGWALWLLGYPDQALKRNEEGIALARRLNHPTTLAMAAAYGAWTYQFCRNAQAAGELAEEAVSVSTKHDLEYYRGMGVVFDGWALTQRGRIAEGIARLQMGLEVFRATEGGLMLSTFSALLAEVYGVTGQASEGLRVLDAISRAPDRYWDAEIDRLRGELILKQHQGGDAEDLEATAEEFFRRALAKAQEQSAKSLELRAAISMSRLRIRQGRRAEAHALMKETFGWFTEGFNTPDLREARMLLDDLQSREAAL
jgi:tetratricopeptide (TPR) repeat protein